MKSLHKISRFFYLMVALLLGFAVVFALSKVSEKSKGPIATVLEKAENTVEEVEKTIIVEQRSYSRKDKLKWLSPIREDREKLIHSDVVLFGASDQSKRESYESIINLEDSLRMTFPIISIYQAWGEKEAQNFPMREVKAIHSIGSVPMITWEPWVSEFSLENFPEIAVVEERDKNAMSYIYWGKYDAFIRKWALAAKNFGHPFYLRLGHEMNEPYRYPWGPQNNTPQEFVAGWQHVHDVFTQVGATNVIWVWSPHPAYGYFDAYFPGSQYVDVVATGILNFGTSTSWSKWWTFDELFGQHYKEFAAFNKPIMIAEFGSLKPGGDRAKWFGDAFRDFKKKYPLINSVVFFHYPGDKTTSDKTVNWYIKDDPKVTAEIRKQIRSWNPSHVQPGLE